MRRPLAAAGAVVALAVSAAGAPATTSAGILPVAVNDSYSAVHNQLLTVAAPGVLKNDLQLGSGFKAKLVNHVAHGTLGLKADGSFTYRSAPTYVGSDSFTYRVDGGVLGLSNVATVTINVTNAAPVARPDAYSAVAGVDKSVGKPGVLGNDTDADGDHMKIDVVQQPAHGNLDAHDDGSFKYKADKGFSGTDTWSYRVWDGVSWSNVVTVTMTVSGPATPPPTAAPTPRPTPAPTPRPTPVPTPVPTIAPIISLPPLASILPIPTPVPTVSVTSRPTATPTPTAPPTPTLAVATGPTELPGGPLGPAGPVATPGQGPTDGPPSDPGGSVAPEAPFTMPTIDDGSSLGLDMGALTFGGFEWAVPALVLTVPGILLVIAVLAQAAIGLAWLPVARRWLGDDERRRSRTTGVRAG
jgi:Big-like domain-containing protein